MLQYLKHVRVIIALFVFTILALLFIAIPGIIPGWAITEILTLLQFIPSLLRADLIPNVAIGFIFVSLLTFFFGRVYCSMICPLGIFQDIIARISNIFKKRKKYRFSKPFNYLRYSVLIIVIVSVCAGSILLINLFDPFSNFGKIFSGLFKPVAVIINNLLSHLLEKFGIYLIPPLEIKPLHWQVLIYPIIFLGVLIIMSSMRGRLFCNTICPVGSLLSVISNFSVYKLKINDHVCNRCGKCSTVCKSECIDSKSKQIDFNRCVACFNCIKACPEKGLKYKYSLNFSKKYLKTDLNSFLYKTQNIIKKKELPKSKNLLTDRRIFLAKGLFFIFGSNMVFNNIKAQISGEKAGKQSFKRKYMITPPGSYSLENFTKHCTACHLCVSTCPSQVLQPSFMQYGISGFMQPYLDFNISFCNYECVKCTIVCPNGAILPLTIEGKKTIQIGKVIFLIDNCIVYTDETSCGACAEHCPTKAVRMVSYKGALKIPETDVNICVGCGACEYACPAEPSKAIYVEGNPVHQTAFRYKEKKQQDTFLRDFPF